ncbi:FecR family protein [Halarcobacter ebronensis]|uniref:FecR protein domain-containing protein n=1 Tax=Halarcobacter ebronensis TaxID=1462615 RepID=A0A4V1M0R4_9BACT|nr:FecR family protein [Halarcobacter ebronensis]QKF82379.1 FecR domain-containing protein [Halarcobacter ebronensis]RXK07595.1 hypothetical protein CRV07_03800 [Halarcobacter ebronensis]
MKKILLLLTVCFLTTLFGSIGSISTIEGKVEIQRQNSLIQAQVNSEIERYDIITTGKDSIARIVLNDNTLITIGKESALNIEEYVFDEKDSSKNETNFNFFKGAFKSVTGKIGKINPSKFKLKTKSATIGIRGTTIIGNQERIIVLEGSVLVTSQNKSVIVNSGQYTNTLPNQAPSDAQDYNQDQEQPISEQLGEEEKEAEATLPQTEGATDNPSTSNASSVANDVQNDAQDIANTPAAFDSERVYPTKWNKPSQASEDISGLNQLEGYSTSYSEGTYSATEDNIIRVFLDSSQIFAQIGSYELGTKTEPDSYYYINSDYFGGINEDRIWMQAIPDVLNTDGTYSVNNDNHISWGYWGNSADIKGTWVAGNLITINNYDTSINVNYSGHMIGYTKAIGDPTLNTILYDNNNSFNMNLNLGAGTNGQVTGTFSFNTSNNESWSGSFNSTTNVSSDRFSATISTLDKSPGVLDSQSISNLNGKFYGTGNNTVPTSVGGNFSINTTTNQAFGSFIGDRQ